MTVNKHAESVLAARPRARLLRISGTAPGGAGILLPDLRFVVKDDSTGERLGEGPTASDAWLDALERVGIQEDR